MNEHMEEGKLEEGMADNLGHLDIKSPPSATNAV